MKAIVFSDIDGTLIDLETFDITPSLEGISILKNKNIPLVFCSAKTKAEQEKIRERLQVTDPFIVENGGGIYIPLYYFSFPITPNIFPSSYREVNIVVKEHYTILILGTPYSTIRKIIEKIRKKTGLSFKGFGDMSAKEVAAITGLKLEDAIAAKAREFDETLVLNREKEVEILKKYISSYGLTLVGGGRFYHLMGNSSKGRCVSLLSQLFRKEEGKIITVGIGDGPNDLPMLEVVDFPILVEQKRGGWINAPGKDIIRVPGIGPHGFSLAIKYCLKNNIF